MIGGGDILAMENLTKEMKEEALEEQENLTSEPEEEEEAKAESTSEPTEAVKEEEIAEEIEEESTKESKKKTPEDYKKIRLALKEKDKLIAEERLKNAKLEGFKEGSTKAQPAKVEVEAVKAEEDPEPDAEFDALNWLKWNARQQNKKIDESLKQSSTATALTQAQIEQAQIIKADNEFQEKHPDYPDAVDHIFEVEKNLILAKYPNATQAQIDQVLVAEKVKLYKEEHKAGRVPGETVMRMAKAYGYVGKKAPNNPEGKNSKTSKTEKNPNLSNIKKNMQKSSPMTGSSAEAKGDVDPESIFNMSMAKLARMPKQAWDKAEKTAREIDADDF